MYITARHPDAQMAADMAGANADAAKRFITETMGTDEPSLFSVALQPTEPVSPRKTLNTVLGALVGGLVMAAILVVRFIMDDKIKTSEDITKYLGIPTLAIVPALGTQNNAKRSVWPKERQGR